MKKIILSGVLGLVTLLATAQIKTPAPSPLSKIEQTVGLHPVKVEYSRPGVKGRVIFGGLVPYDKIWRTGANKNTTISFAQDVKIQGEELKKGEYALYTKPGKESWDVYFYTDTDKFGVPSDWDDKKIALQVTTKPQTIKEHVETFLINFGELTNSSTHLELIWDNTLVPIKIEVPSDEEALKSIEKTMAGPSAFDYFRAASYYRANGKDLNKAKEWIEKAVSTEDGQRFFIVREQSEILAALKDYKGAIKAAKKSKELSEKAGNEQFVKFNEEAIAKWSKML